LGAAAVIGELGHRAVGQVAAGTYRGGDGFEVGAGFGVDVARQPRHPIGALLAEQQAASSGPVGFVVVAVGVEDLIDASGEGFDDVGVVFDRFAHQAALDVVAIGGRHTGGEHVDRVADHPQVVFTDPAGRHRGRDMRQLRLDRWAGELAARPKTTSGLHAAFDFARRDAQPRGQAVHQRWGHRGLIGRVGDLAEHPIHQAAVAAVLKLEPFGQLGPKIVAHRIGGQLTHLGIGSLDLISQRAKPLARRLPSNEFAHTPTLSTTCVKQWPLTINHPTPVDEVRSGDNRCATRGFVGPTC
jgi:hypothetical protein